MNFSPDNDLRSKLVENNQKVNKKYSYLSYHFFHLLYIYILRERDSGGEQNRK